MNWEKQNEAAKEVPQTFLNFDLSDEEKEIVSLLRQYPDGLQVNELAIMLSKPFSKTSSKLLEMEFKGLVKCFPGNLYRIVK